MLDVIGTGSCKTQHHDEIAKDLAFPADFDDLLADVCRAYECHLLLLAVLIFLNR